MKQKRFSFHRTSPVSILSKRCLFGTLIHCRPFMVMHLSIFFDSAFPHHLTMKQMDMEHMRIYIREMDKDIFYQLEDIQWVHQSLVFEGIVMSSSRSSDVKDRSVLKLIQFAPSKPHVSFKKPEIEALVQSDDVNYQRLTRFSQESNMNDSDEDSTASRSLSEPRYRMATHDHLPSPTSTGHFAFRSILWDLVVCSSTERNSLLTKRWIHHASHRWHRWRSVMQTIVVCRKRHSSSVSLESKWPWWRNSCNRWQH